MAAQNGKDLLIKVDMDDAGSFETLAGLRAFEGAFQITSLEYAGNYDGEATYDMAFASAGALTFTAI